jgi:hypothetical protein
MTWNLLVLFLLNLRTVVAFIPCQNSNVCFNVMNNCSVPLTMHGWNNAAPKSILEPDKLILNMGDIHQYAVSDSFAAGRLEARIGNTAVVDFVEMTVENGFINYDISYVDSVVLPAAMQAIGSSCTQGPICNVPREDLLAGCPSDLREVDKCLSAGSFCSYLSNQGTSFCTLLNGQIAKCASEFPSTCGLGKSDKTGNVYSCSGYFDSQLGHPDGNKFCAALNRGMLANPDSSDTSLYYQTPPYNAYAKYVHETCPGIYSFPYDDYHSQGGDRSCQSSRLDIVFCPAG